MIIYLIANSIPWLSIVVILLLLIVGFLINRYILYPFYISIYTSLSVQERIEILNRENCLYMRHRLLKNKDLSKSPFNKDEVWDTLFWLERQEFVEAIDLKSDEVCYYWIKIKKSMFFFPFTTKETAVVKEVDLDIIALYKNWTESEIVIFNSHCPACGAVIQENDVKCPDCDLTLE